MRYPGDEFESKKDFEWYEAEAEKRRTDPVYGMREFPQLMMCEPPEILCVVEERDIIDLDKPRANGLLTRRQVYNALKARSIELQEQAEFNG